MSQQEDGRALPVPKALPQVHVRVRIPPAVPPPTASSQSSAAASAAANASASPQQQPLAIPEIAAKDFELPLYFGVACTDEAMLETWAAPDLVQLQSELDTMRSTMKLVTTSLVPRGSLTAHDFPPSHTPRRLLEGRGGEAGAGSSPEFHVYSGKTAGRGSVSGAMHPARGGLRLTADGDDGEQDGLVDAGVPKDEEEEDEDEESDGDGEAMAVDDGAPAATGAAKVLAQSAAESHAATGKAPEKTAGKKTSRGRKPIPAKKQQPLQTPGSTEAAAGGAAAKAAAQTSSGAPKAKGRRKKRTRDSEDDGEGKKAGSSSGGVTYAQNFWSTMETYLRPLTRKDLELLEPVTEQQVQELCVIPPLGKHYLKVWAEEDAELAERHAHDTPGDLMDEYQHPESTPLQAARPASSHTSRHATRQSTAAREGADDSDGETVIDLTQRLMAAVLECPGDTQRPPPVLSLEDEDPVAHRAAVDAGIRSELVALKLLQSGETRDPSHDEDDELCHDLRMLFAIYADHVQALNAKREQLYKRVLERSREGEVREQERIAARQAIEAYQKLAKKPTKRSSGKGPGQPPGTQ